MPLVFLVAAALFALQMARHLRVFAAAKPATVTDQPERRFDSLIRYAIVQVRMFRELDAGLLHAAIFWGFVILTVGTADRVSFGLVHAVLAWPLDGWLWRLLLPVQNLLALSVLGAVAWALGRRLILRPRRLTLSRDGLTILLLIGAVVATELLAEAFRLGRYGDPDAAWAFAANSLGGVLAAVLPSGVMESATPSSSGPTSWWSASSWPTCRAPSTCTSPPRSSTPRSASSSRAASCRPWTWRPRPRASASRPSRTCPGRTSWTASPAPSAAAARTPARPGRPASRSTPRR